MSIVNNRPEIKRNFKVNRLPITCIHITCVRSWIRKQNRACPRSHSVLLYRDIESYAVISACVVLQEYAQQGIGSRIMEKCLDVVREYNYDLLYGCFSSFFSQRISAKFGFETILEVPYSGYLNQKNSLRKWNRFINSTLTKSNEFETKVTEHSFGLGQHITKSEFDWEIEPRGDLIFLHLNGEEGEEPREGWTPLSLPLLA